MQVRFEYSLGGVYKVQVAYDTEDQMLRCSNGKDFPFRNASPRMQEAALAAKRAEIKRINQEVIL